MIKKAVSPSQKSSRPKYFASFPSIEPSNPFILNWANALEEYDYSPYNCFANTIQIETKKYRIKHIEKKIPMVYALVATKK